MKRPLNPALAAPEGLPREHVDIAHYHSPKGLIGAGDATLPEVLVLRILRIKRGDGGRLESIEVTLPGSDTFR